jgi:hypothetical protein
MSNANYEGPDYELMSGLSRFFCKVDDYSNHPVISGRYSECGPTLKLPLAVFSCLPLPVISTQVFCLVLTAAEKTRDSLTYYTTLLPVFYKTCNLKRSVLFTFMYFYL